MSTIYSFSEHQTNLSLMETLVSSTVYRAGRTARTLSHETNNVRVGVARDADAVRVNFELNSKGGGVTEVQREIGGADFTALVSAMLRADRQAAMQVMAAAISSEIAKQPERDRNNVRLGRESVKEAAERAYYEAPSDNEHAARFASDVVDRLVADLNAADKAALEADKKAA